MHVELNLKDVTPAQNVYKISWKNYTPEILKIKLSDSLESAKFEWHSLNVQEHWNQLENLIINVTDELAPLTQYDENTCPKNKKVPPHVKNKINLRKRLVTLEKKRNSVEQAPRIKLLSKSISDYFANDKAKMVRHAAMGSKVNLWKAVNITKSLNCSSIPKNLTLGGVPITEGKAAESFARFFYDKIKSNVIKTTINPDTVYNGKCKLIVQNRNFIFYCISDQISMDSLNLTFVHFKKLAKIQFLKYGRT